MPFFSIMGILLGSRILARVKDVQWQEHTWGEMIISRGEVCLQEKRKSFQFRKQNDAGLRIPMVLIASNDIDNNQRLMIHWIDQDDNSFEDVFIFKKQGDAGAIAAALGRALKELGEESKQAQLERAEMLRRQKEERERQEEFQRVKDERELVWKTVRQIWEIVLQLNEITLALPGEDWQSIEAAWRKMRSISEKTVLDLSIGANSFMPALESRSADEMHKDALSFTKLLGDSIKAMQIARVEEEGLARQYESFPQWNHVPYFLLFALIYTETILCHKSGDNDTVKNNLAKLGKLAIVLQDEFGLNLEESINLFAAGFETGDPGQVRATGQALEDCLSEALGKGIGHN